MSLIVRIDVDRPYGLRPVWRHLLSRVSSDWWFPTIEAFGYLLELQQMLRWLNASGARAHVFFRRCTLPSPPVLDLLHRGGHTVGLHLENSRSRATFLTEKQDLERWVHGKITSLSKHGSGVHRYGRHHVAAYEPERYIEWAGQAGMRLFLGNLQDPTLCPLSTAHGLQVFPSAFWLEPHWRDTRRFPLDWLLREAVHRDIVLLVHPENVLDRDNLVRDFRRSVDTTPTRILA